MPAPALLLTGMTASLVSSGVCAATFAGLADDELLSTQAASATARHEVDRISALAAAEIARRSTPEHGLDSLARRSGFADADTLLVSLTGSTKAEARSLARVGEMIAVTDAAIDLSAARDADPDLAAVVPPVETPWYAALAVLVTAGRLTVAVADVIQAGLGEITDAVTADDLEAALAALLTELLGADGTHRVHVAEARNAARAARDLIDTAGVAVREAALRNKQYWRQWIGPDGMYRGEYALDPENGALLQSVHDQLTHPRRQPDPKKRAFGAAPVRDPFVERSARERDAAEGLVQLVRAGASVDPMRLLDTETPSVRVVVNEQALRTGSGFAALEGHPGAVSLATIERGLCAGYLPVLFSATGQPLNLGRDERLFTRTQRIAITLRDGGCLEPDCDRPPSWTEVHHIKHWKRDHGNTDVADGVLLCRRGHLRVHNEGWEISRDNHDRYWLIPPPIIDPTQTPRLMKPKTMAEITHPVTLPAALEPAATATG
ncbi:DUF222 domain-containing protein [Leifsonia sp. YIM 134122]|uniref:DUF222 domain-containing protein n=1 Tax=Leifsonia stereocauli TaxID=3134136 RepID=A0ABU9W2Y1_9MICO